MRAKCGKFMKGFQRVWVFGGGYCHSSTPSCESSEKKAPCWDMRPQIRSARCMWNRARQNLLFYLKQF
eukprot:3842325-Amphidinium_carterae.1